MSKLVGIKYIGPIFDNSGYAKACRSNILSLLTQGVSITLSPISFENMSPDLGADGDILKELINKDIEYNVVIVHTTPEFWDKYREPGKTMVNYTIWETTKLHPEWIPYINNGADKVLVGCEWNVDVFKDSGVTIPIGCIPHCIDIKEDDVVPYAINGISDDTFVFYDIFQWCYDDKTRALTKNGFKYFKDLTYEDELATMNLSTEELEYHKPDKIVNFNRDGKMLELKSQAFDICVTPDHKMVVNDEKEDVWKLKPFNELLSKKRDGSLLVNSAYKTKKSCNWSGKEQSSFKLSDCTLITMDAFLEFMGWYLSEGSTLNTGNGYVTTITQKKEKYIPEILDCCERAGLHTFFGGVDNKDIRISSKELHLYLTSFGKCYEKYIPSFIKELSSRQILIFLTALFKGDGSFHKDGRFMKYTTTSKVFAEDLQECLLKVNMSGAVCTEDPANKIPGTIDGRKIIGKRLQYVVSVNSKQTEPKMCYADLKEVDYKGKVYCATVKNHNMLVERCGKVVFSGNTERKDPLSLLKAYWYAFQNDEDVALVLKTYRSDYSDQEKNAIRMTINRLKAVTVFDKYPKIYFIPDMLTEDEISGLHKRGDCYITTDRGEGFGLSPFTAGANGNPVIATGFGGSTEYLKEDNSYLINYFLTPVHGMPWSNWYKAEQLWAQSDVTHAAELMQEVYTNKEKALEKGKKLQEYISTDFSYEAIGKRIINEIEDIL